MLLLSFVILLPAVFATSPPWYPNEESEITMKLADLQKFCPKWTEWQTQKCWWPDTTWEQLPPACRALPQMPNVPAWFAQFAARKHREPYDALLHEFEQVGKPARCGRCSRSVRCRARTAHPAIPLLPPWCTPDTEQQTLFDGADCDDTDNPCELDAVGGVCEAPAFTYTLEYLKSIVADSLPLELVDLEGYTKFGEKSADEYEEIDDVLTKIFDRILEDTDFEGPFAAISELIPFDNDKTGKTRQKRSPPKNMEDLMGEPAEVKAFIVYTILNGTNCVKTDDQKCLCCCGPFVPDIDTHSCRDASAFLSRSPVPLPPIDPMYPQYSVDDPEKSKKSSSEKSKKSSSEESKKSSSEESESVETREFSDVPSDDDVESFMSGSVLPSLRQALGRLLMKRQ